MKLKPVTWLNRNRKKMRDMPPISLHRKDMDTVVSLWKRFAPFITKVFPETIATNGAHSSLKEAKDMKLRLEEEGTAIPGRVFVKCDNDLAVAGSIKARGGFYEILYYAERLGILEFPEMG